MSMQISLKISDQMRSRAKKYAEAHGFDNLQDLIRSLLRERLFEEKKEKNRHLAYTASETSLARHWTTEAEDKAWAHLQKET